MIRFRRRFLLLGFLFAAVVAGCSAPGSGSGGSSGPVVTGGGPVRVACVGDSITQGVGLDNPSVEAYPEVLQAILGSGHDVRNFGSAGATAITFNPLQDFRNRPPYKPSLAFQPHIVVIMFGTNDSSSGAWPGQTTFIEEYAQLIQTYQALPTKPKIYICHPPRSFLKAAELTGGIRRVAERVNAEGTIDLYNGVADKMLSDTIHPNAHGHRNMARRVAEAIQ